MNRPEWMNDSSLADIDRAKLDFLQILVSQGSQLSPKEMLPFLMELGKQGKKSSISFTKEEMELIITVLKRNSTPDELERMDKIIHLMRKRQ